MKKLIALYKLPADTDAFMRHYRLEHLPLVEKIPGLVKTELTMIERTLMGNAGNFLLAEMYFEDDRFKEAMKSAANAATGRDLERFAGAGVTIMTGGVLEA